MKTQIQITAIFVLLAPFFVHAEWYWITVPNNPETGYFKEYTPPTTIGYIATDKAEADATSTLVPDSFMKTIEKTKDSNKCSSEIDGVISKLREFDASHDLYTHCSELYLPPYRECKGAPSHFVNEKTIKARESLIIKIEKNVLQCLKTEENEIKKKDEEQKRKEAESKRIIEVEKAVAECDFEFFEDEMTDKERMNTWNERETCKNMTKYDAAHKEVEEIPAEVKHVPIVQNIPEITYVPPSPRIVQAENVVKTDSVMREAVEVSVIPDIVSTTTQESVDLEPDDYTNTENPPQQHEKPSIFRRIVNFFASWFN